MTNDDKMENIQVEETTFLKTSEQKKMFKKDLTKPEDLTKPDVDPLYEWLKKEHPALLAEAEMNLNRLES